MADKGQRRLEAKARQAVSDVFSQAGALALTVFVVVGILAGAIAGISMIERLGGAGWMIYGVVLGTWALLFGPLVAAIATLHQRGSPRYRAAKQKRLEADEIHLGLREPGAPTAPPPAKTRDERK